MKRLKLSVLGQKPVKLFHQLVEIQKSHKHIALVKGNQITIGNIAENMIHFIINFNLLLTTNANSIVMIE